MSDLTSISLITICWNAAATIARTLDSVLEQSELPQQYVVVDGGSTDGTLEILEKYRARFVAAGVEFTIVNQREHPDQAGIPHAWNQAVLRAHNDIVAILNADDWYSADTLRVVAQEFRHHPECDAVVGRMALMTSENDFNFKVVKSRPLTLLPVLMPLPHPACFFRWAVYDRIGFYDANYYISADYDFIWRCRVNDVKFHTIDKIVTFMQIGGRANSNRALARRETYRIARKYCHPWDPRPLLALIFRWVTRR